MTSIRLEPSPGLAFRAPVEALASETLERHRPPRLADDPRNTPPPGAIPFIAQERASLIGSAVSDVTAILARLQCPQFYLGVVRELSFFVNDLATTSNIVFAMRVNQAVLPSTSIEVFPKNASSDLIEFDPNTTRIEVPEGATADVQVTIRAGDVGTYLVGAMYRGWWYPEEYVSDAS